MQKWLLNVSHFCFIFYNKKQPKETLGFASPFRFSQIRDYDKHVEVFKNEESLGIGAH